MKSIQEIYRIEYIEVFTSIESDQFYISKYRHYILFLYNTIKLLEEAPQV